MRGLNERMDIKPLVQFLIHVVGAEHVSLTIVLHKSSKPGRASRKQVQSRILVRELRTETGDIQGKHQEQKSNKMEIVSGRWCLDLESGSR